MSEDIEFRLADDHTYPSMTPTTRPALTEPATEAMDRALDGAMATAGLSVKPSHYTRHVLTRLAEQGWALIEAEAVQREREALVELVAERLHADADTDHQWRAQGCQADGFVADARRLLGLDA